ncbi:MAG: hypothetical protein PVG72_07215, partial [Gammaproteobacteria bacterium]
MLPGYFRQLFADRRDAGQCRRQMQGCQWYKCMQSGQQAGRDALGPDVLAAVHHAVTDGIHVRQLRVLQQNIERCAMLRRSRCFSQCLSRCMQAAGVP